MFAARPYTVSVGTATTSSFLNKATAFSKILVFIFYLNWTYFDHKKFEILLNLSNIKNTQYIIKDFIMSSVNKVILIGNLTRKPELRQTQSQTSVTTLSIATNDRRKNSSGEYENVAEYHDVVVFGRTAENCELFLDKGRQVYIEGKLQTRKYTDKDGNERRKTEILVQPSCISEFQGSCFRLVIQST